MFRFISILVIKLVYFFLSAPIVLLALILLMPSFILKKDKITDVSLFLAYIPFKYGEFVRYFFYKIVLDSLGRNVVFKFGSYCQFRNIRIGNNVLIGYFNSLGLVVIGDDVLLGGYVNIISGTKQHGFSDKNLTIREQPGEGRMLINIGSDVWIGSNVTIASSVGTRCVVAFGSVVVRDIPSNTVVAGNPAKLIRELR